MPGFSTHYIFGHFITQNLSKNSIQAAIKKHPSVYHLGLQGPDLFFYDVQKIIQTKTTKYGSVLHRYETDGLFASFLHELMGRSIEDQTIGIAYVAGFLSHYYLDANTHPYIYSKTSYHYVSGDIPKVYYARHRRFETDLDQLLVRRMTPFSAKRFRQDQTIQLSIKEQRVVSRFLADSINRTFLQSEDHSMHLTASYVSRCIHCLRLGTRILYDPTHLKYRLLTWLENHTVHFALMSSMILSPKPLKAEILLNQLRKPWQLSWEPHTVYHESFLDLFRRAKEECLTCLNDFNVLLEEMPVSLSMQYKEKPFDDYIKPFIQSLNSRSYHTGVDWRTSYH